MLPVGSIVLKETAVCKHRRGTRLRLSRERQTKTPGARFPRLIGGEAGSWLYCNRYCNRGDTLWYTMVSSEHHECGNANSGVLYDTV